MNTTNKPLNRRDLLKAGAAVASVAAATGLGIPAVHAAGSGLVQLALVGCGGRGTGAVGNAFSTVKDQGPLKLVAMADIFENKLNNSFKSLQKYKELVAVPQDRQFLGFDAYKKAMDSLKAGDVVILTTPCAFRWVMFKYAIEKGLHVFMEKPITVDGPTTRRMIALGEEAKKKNLKVGVGLMIRHCRGRQQLKERIDKGEIGPITAMRAYRMGGGGGYCGPKPANMTEVMYQTQKFHSFLWSGGGVFSDYNIHQIDECSMMKGSWPVKAHAVGGRHFRGNTVDQNFDSYAVEYTYADGVKLWFTGRQMPGCHSEFASYVDGVSGCAIVSTSAHVPGKVRTFKGHNFAKEDQIWAFPQPEPNPYDMEWVDFIDAIRVDKEYNEVKRGAEASLVTSMGRMAAHTGQIITYEDIYNSTHEFAPDVENLTPDGPAPLKADKDGKYPVPMPGLIRGREY